jgi:hypothetical protein
MTDRGNHSVRRLTMEEEAGHGQEGYADGEGAAVRFDCPCAVVVDKEGTIAVADRGNHRLRRMTGQYLRR